MNPARGESCPLGQRQGPAAPGEDGVSSLDHKSFHVSTTPTNRGLKRKSPGSIPPRTMWKPQTHWLIADWLELTEQARGESCPSGYNVDVAPHPGRTRFHPRITNPSIYLRLQQTRDQDSDPTGRNHLTRCRNPNSGYNIVD